MGKSLGDIDLNLCPPSSFCRRGHHITQLEHSVAHRFTPLYSKKGGGGVRGVHNTHTYIEAVHTKYHGWFFVVVVVVSI